MDETIQQARDRRAAIAEAEGDAGGGGRLNTFRRAHFLRQARKQ